MAVRRYAMAAVLRLLWSCRWSMLMICECSAKPFVWSYGIRYLKLALPHTDPGLEPWRHVTFIRSFTSVRSLVLGLLPQGNPPNTAA